ncbi:MAG: tetratricopeptide repeat-containing glycosyltransferase [Sulfurihydrogenibium sp.]|uniref:tetratricopeptide repeat-containing glycosyltransferase n=1 Tax=Sulfurihydrogenibium sp. TaxID=2053621 RepID=UPI003C7DA1BE
MKITLGILKTTKNENPVKDEVIEGIQDNLEYFDEIIYTGNEDFFEDSDIEVKALNLDTDNKAVMRNAILDNTSNELIMWISDTTILEFDMIPEMLEKLEESPDADILYPNMSIIDNEGREKIFRLEDLYCKEKDILMSLKPENHVPEYGIITKRSIFDKFGKFDENFKDYDFYNFLYQNLENIRLKFAEFNYVVIHYLDPFIDTSYRSYALKKALKKYNIKDFFPKLSWDENENLAVSTAYTAVGDTLSDYYDLFSASEFYRKALLSFYNKLTLLKLIKTYFNMGLFEEAKKLAKVEQGLKPEEEKTYQEEINQAENLIKSMEEAINEGKVQEILSVINEVTNHYQGAPLYNIIGVIEYYMKNYDNAYKFFYKAATLNPLDEDIIHNLTSVANQLGKQEDVKGLFKRVFEI